MSTMTDRASGQNLIKLAKQQYEQQQRLTLPSNTVKLPSNGLVYMESSPLRSGEVEIRYMTAYDEDIITNSTYIRDNTVYERLLESIIVTPGVNVSEIVIGDRDAILVAARIYSYEKSYPIIVSENGNEVVKQIDLTKIPHKPFTLTTDDMGEVSYETESGLKLKFRFLNIGDIHYIANLEESKSTAMLQTMLTEINGERDPEYINNYVRYNLIVRETRKLQAYIVEHMPGLSSQEIEFEGESGDTFRATFQAGIQLFWV